MLSQSMQQMGVTITDQQKLNRMATSLTNLQCYKAACTDYLSCIITNGCTTDEDGIRGVEKFHLPAQKKFMRTEDMRQIQCFGTVTGSFLLIACCMVSTVMAVANQVVFQCLKEVFYHQRPGLLT